MRLPAYTKYQLYPIDTYSRLGKLATNPNFLTLLKFNANQADILDATVSYLENPEFYKNHKNFVINYNNVLYSPSIDISSNSAQRKLMDYSWKNFGLQYNYKDAFKICKTSGIYQ